LVIAIQKFFVVGIAAGRDTPARPDQLAARYNQPDHGAQDEVTQLYFVRKRRR
jgi:hypothetical protein